MPFILQPQRRRHRLRPRRLSLHRHGRRRQRRRPAGQRPEPATRCSARCCASTSAPARAARTASRPDNPFVGAARARATRSGPTACATPGASPSTARPARSGPATSARTRARRSTSSTKGGNYGWNVMEGTHLPPAGNELRHATASCRRCSTTPTATATAPSPAASSTAATRSRARRRLRLRRLLQRQVWALRYDGTGPGAERAAAGDWRQRLSASATTVSASGRSRSRQVPFWSACRRHLPMSARSRVMVTTVSLTGPAANGGFVVTGYVVTPYVGATAGAPRVFTSTAGSQVITGLANGTAYASRRPRGMRTARTTIGRSSPMSSVLPAPNGATAPRSRTGDSAVEYGVQQRLRDQWLRDHAVQGRRRTTSSDVHRRRHDPSCHRPHEWRATRSRLRRRTGGTGARSAASNAVTPS